MAMLILCRACFLILYVSLFLLNTYYCDACHRMAIPIALQRANYEVRAGALKLN